jgi:phosphatidylglycerophosphatase C
MAQTPSSRAGVAAFDFDGTVSTRDNVVPFLRAVAGDLGLLRVAATNAHKLVAARFIDDRRDEAKAAVVRAVFTGRSVEDVTRVAGGFAETVLREHLRPELVERLRWHQAEGHVVVFVSASLTPYLRAIAAALDVSAALSTDLAIGPDARYTGAITGHNVRGQEKVRRLDAWLAGTGLLDAEVWAYGDSRGDRELLTRADHPFWVRSSAIVPA